MLLVEQITVETVAHHLWVLWQQPQVAVVALGELPAPILREQEVTAPLVVVVPEQQEQGERVVLGVMVEQGKMRVHTLVEVAGALVAMELLVLQAELVEAGIAFGHQPMELADLEKPTLLQARGRREQLIPATEVVEQQRGILPHMQAELVDRALSVYAMQALL